MDFKEYLEKMQGWPDSRKKLFLWTIVGVLAVIMGFFWVKSALNDINKIGQSVGQIKIPQISTHENSILTTTSPSHN